MLSAKTFTSSLKNEPLRSYAIHVLRLINRSDIVAVSDGSDATTSDQRLVILRCPDNDVKFEKHYTPSTQTFPQPSMQAADLQHDYNTTVQPRRTIEIRSRISMDETTKHSVYNHSKFFPYSATSQSRVIDF